MIIYHLGFPFHSYLASKLSPGAVVIECDPVKDTADSVLTRSRKHSDFFFHIDLTVQPNIPPGRRELINSLISRGVTVHNAHHDDQRKRMLQKVSHELGFQSLTAPQAGDPNEKLMVKSDLNVAGGPERRTVRRFPDMELPPLPSRVCSPSEYYVALRADIPEVIWDDETLHVEKFIDNPKGSVLRTFWNRGKIVVSVIENPHEVVKKHNEKCRRWNYAHPVDELTEKAFTTMRLYAERLRLSFFAADWVLDEKDSIFIVDLNLTAQWAVNPATHIHNMTPELHIADIPRVLLASIKPQKVSVEHSDGKR